MKLLLNTLLNTLIISCCLFSSMTLAKTYTTEEYQQIFAGDDTYKQQQAVESMILVGLEDPSIYNTIQAKIVAQMHTATDKHAIDNTAWLIKGLGYSGDPQYHDFLLTLSEGYAHKKIRKYAKRAVDDLSKFQVWNVILQDKTHYDNKQPHRQNIYAAALRGDDLELMRIAAKRIANEYLFDDFMLEQLATQLKPMRLMDDSKLAIDTYAWVTRALASSGNEKYKPVVEAVSQTAEQKKLRKYATKYLRKYY
ncbi:hypothetical protein L2737_19060 [Shewanella electrodiphila]|uniref:HEAT repeat domain-containing protein n=1 Tax=Shewanella electrodiphila TaxID=934143 RepID=A0ABT0KUE5_9GAMM|nr:hypothetical protein [Shewanella electrodiphila]MCL1047404.1 hypothetical protein [Shewanella electrodiphila]